MIQLAYLVIAFQAAVVSSQYVVVAQKNMQTVCNKTIGITPNPGRYTFNPNPWGAEDNPGGICMEFGDTKAKNSNATAFSTTWNYDRDAQVVHAYPNARLELPKVIPLQLQHVKGIPVEMAWSYGLGNVGVDPSQTTQLDSVGLRANVAIDFFLDPSQNRSINPNLPQYEVMIWLGAYGHPYPLGWQNLTQANKTVNGVVFNLFVGENDTGQKVFTWTADSNVTYFKADVASFVHGLDVFGGPVETDYLGVVQFGTEVLSLLTTETPVTFWAQNLTMGLVTDLAAQSAASLARPPKTLELTFAALAFSFLFSCMYYF